MREVNISELPEEDKNLVEEARKARGLSYSPYFSFAVGAAILTEDGEIYRGCNIQNQILSLNTCAERTAAIKAVSEGTRRFKKLAVIADTDVPIRPCGVCAQYLFEFNKSGLEVISANLKGRIQLYNLTEVLPLAYQLESP